VFVNGVKLVNGVDYTATNGTTVVLTDALTVGQIVEIDNYLTAFLPTNALRTITTFTATAGQTTFAVTYTQGLIDVFYNGSNLAQSEYTATNGTSIVLATACQLNDIVVVYAYSYAVGAYSGIGGSGTVNTIPKFTASSVIGNSLIFDNGTSVGINTASPTGQASNNTALQIVGAGTGIRAQIKLTNSVSGATGTDGLMLSYDDQLDGYLYNFENGGLIFGTNNAVRLTIASTGSVGIGTTPPTTSTFPHLFSGRNFVTFSGSSNDVYIGSNFYYNGGFLARYSEPSIMINSSNGDIIFGNSASGTAGGALTVTEKMRITSGGVINIGTTASTVYGTLNVIQQSVSAPSFVRGIELVHPNGTGGTGGYIGISMTGQKQGTIQVGDDGAVGNLLLQSQGGNVGIGTTSPGFPLVVKVATNQNLRVSTETHTSVQAINDAVSAFVTLKVDGLPLLLNSQSGGNVLIGTTTDNGLALLQVNGNIYSNRYRLNDGAGGYVSWEMVTNGTRWGINYLARFSGYGAGALTTDASGNITASSDRTLKDIIKPVENVLDRVMDFEPVYFKWNEKTDLDKENVYISTIAQSIEKGFPEAVGHMSDGTLTVQDRAVLAIAIRAIQELKAEIDELKNK
jgi:hypothetical protein